MDELYKEA